MNADYESVRWLTELCYDLFRFSDGVMISVALLLIPFSVIHPVITDKRQKRFSIRRILTTALYCKAKRVNLAEKAERKAAV